MTAQQCEAFNKFLNFCFFHFFFFNINLVLNCKVCRRAKIKVSQLMVITALMIWSNYVKSYVFTFHKIISHSRAIFWVTFWVTLNRCRLSALVLNCPFSILESQPYYRLHLTESAAMNYSFISYSHHINVIFASTVTFDLLTWPQIIEK